MFTKLYFKESWCVLGGGGDVWGFFFILWADARKCLGTRGEVWRRALAIAEAQLWGTRGVWALCSLELFFCQAWSTPSAGTVPAYLGLGEGEVFTAAIALPHGRKFTKEQLQQGGNSPSGGYAPMAPAGCPSGAPFANGMSAYGWNIVVLKPGLFVNLFRCLDGWLATDFIGQY